MKKMIIVVFTFLTLQGCATTNTTSKPKHSNHANSTKPTFLQKFAYNSMVAFSSMGKSNKKVRMYRCGELTQQQAYYLYSKGHRYLDRDKDGKPCER